MTNQNQPITNPTAPEWLRKLIRPDLLELKAYTSARVEAGGFEPAIALDANESPWPPFGSLAAASHSNRYPDPQPATLLGRMAALYGIHTDKMLLCRGSDEGIDLLLRLFGRAGQDEIMVCPPTFGMYKVYASIQGLRTKYVPLTPVEYQLDISAILAALTPATKLIFIPSPNAPMGHKMHPADILALCQATVGKSLIVLDEAYVEFSDMTEGGLGALDAHDNLVILRTLSKAHALAGERIGAVIAMPALISELKKVQAPYPLTQSGVRVATEALSPIGLIEGREKRAILKAERERLRALLPQSKQVLKIFPSETNFLLVEVRDAAQFMATMRKYGILPRDRSSDIPNTIRLSVGTREENNAVLNALEITIPAQNQLKPPRIFSTRRATKETQIEVTVNLDAPNFLEISTGIGFFDHMLSQIATHGGFGLGLTCKGDLVIDQHHTIEDCALALGTCLREALGDKRGIGRFGFSAPLDEALAEAVIDLSGRPHASYEANFPVKEAGEMSVEMVPHFFISLASTLAAAIHIKVKGENTHHMIEASFKAAGRALRQAFKREGDNLPSTKGML